MEGNSLDLDKKDAEFIKRVTPKIEAIIEKRVTARVLEALIDSLEQQNYPPEENIRPEFIQKVKKAEKGTGKRFKSINELKKHLSGK